MNSMKVKLSLKVTQLMICKVKAEYEVILFMILTILNVSIILLVNLNNDSFQS